jgi:hypothetical protein
MANMDYKVEGERRGQRKGGIRGGEGRGGEGRKEEKRRKPTYANEFNKAVTPQKKQ